MTDTTWLNCHKSCHQILKLCKNHRYTLNCSMAHFTFGLAVPTPRWEKWNFYCLAPKSQGYQIWFSESLNTVGWDLAFLELSKRFCCLLNWWFSHFCKLRKMSQNCHSSKNIDQNCKYTTIRDFEVSGPKICGNASCSGTGF